MRKKTGETLAETVLEILSTSEPILKAKIENMTLPDYVLCYILRAMAILSKKRKLWNLLVRRRRPLCGFGNFEKKIQNFGFFCKFRKLSRILKDYELPFPK